MNLKNQMEKIENIEKSKYPLECESNSILILDYSKEKEMNDPRVEAMFNRSRHNKLALFTISQEYHELPKQNIRAYFQTKYL